ncbi:MAG TPA: hypothetical protein VNF47_23890 [Streptosporangiaceae bacterium]|nr:hypothetical protein [Streptosporangiaceae bacterium]
MSMPSPYLRPPAPRAPQARLSRLWAWVPVLSLGTVSFLPFLRLALLRRRPKDWAVFAGYAVVNVALLAAAGSVSGKSAVGSGLGGLMVLLMGTATVHALVEFRTLPPPPPNLALPVSYPGQDPVAVARARIARRTEARKLAGRDPVLARELRIGRPDLPSQFDDGGLVDVNTVPAEVLAAQLQLTEPEVESVLGARSQLGRFTSADELSVYAQLDPARLDAIRDLLWFS